MRLLSICVLISISLVSAIAQDVTEKDQKCVDRALKIARSLEKGNPVRESVERGSYGDCVRFDWMEEMREFGIKHASYLVEYEWKGKSVNFVIKSTSYLTTYYTDFSLYSIKDKVLLRKIKQTGLGRKLENVVMTRVQKSGFAKRTKGSVRKDLFQIDLFDDESLPRLGMIF